MKKVNVAEAAKHFGVSKEAIHNRIRRGSLEVVVNDGVKMVLLDTTKIPKRRVSSVTPKSSQNDERYYKLLQEQNLKLQTRIDSLENETRSLRDQKELMLIAERKKIEEIYKEKDEQLKNVLSTLSTQFMLTQTKKEHPEEIELETVDVEVSEPKIISLKKFIKSLDVSEKKAKKIKENFIKKAKNDERITVIDKKIYLDTARYDYKDFTKKK